ncbi:glycosyltransferase [Flavobacterium amnicola]|uniref:Glycosyltransferase n=1 Tax=Flavobacterium amnicola TaxID=2506422 RepID=A0A4Q1K0S4_9FLAO|nr:glycosyltransferase [Flavobacterium amnicola]RXR17742.1 glycosyltransferase [Flavobacterium amnicola]
MRVLQIIDSLNAGGAEKMSVNYANALADVVDFSGIIVTRKEGILKQQLKTNVYYSFINRKTFFDTKALKKIITQIRKNKIDVIHAHGTSFFLAFLVKLFCWNVKVIFHEHNGNRSNQSYYKNIPLLFCNLFFHRILVVNQQIESWFKKVGFKKVNYFPNFASFETDNAKNTLLNGVENKRIICLANLRDPKNHEILVRAFHELNLKNEDWTLHFVGKNYHDDYSEKISKLIKELDIIDSVFLYDAKSDIEFILTQSTIGVLCSTYEGFPVTLLEYGLAKLPVISSNVGYCPKIIIDNETGLLFNSNDLNGLTNCLSLMINDFEKRTNYAKKLNYLVHTKYGKVAIINQLLDCYNK